MRWQGGRAAATRSSPEQPRERDRCSDDDGQQERKRPHARERQDHRHLRRYDLDGTVIIMVYENRTWRLLVLTQDKAHEIAQAQYLRALPVELEGVDSNNPWKALLDIPEEDERALCESTKPADETKVTELDQAAV